MRLTLLAVGSRGDVQPYVALSAGLRDAGHDVRLATHAPFKALVEAHGLEFAPIAGDPRRLIEQDAAQAWLASGRNPIAFTRRLRPLVASLFEDAVPDMVRACAGAEAILYSAFGFPGWHIAQAAAVPAIALFLQPVHRTGAFPYALSPTDRNLAPWLNRLTHRAGEQAFWQAVGGMVNDWRVASLGLPPLGPLGPFRQMEADRETVLYGYSPSVLPKPPDWPPWIHVTGYWFLPSRPWQAPAELEAFLADGPPPLFIGFGSMRPRDPAALAATVRDALRRTGRRAVIQSGWAELGEDAGALPGVITVGEAPHDQLFPRMAAVAHHGGAGTTGTAIRAGVPSVVVPLFADQFFWAGRVRRLGVGPRAPSMRNLRADALAGALEAAATNPELRPRAAALGTSVAAEDGVGCAVEALEAALVHTSSRRAMRIPPAEAAV